MSKQVGIIKLKGKLGDLSFYQAKGESYARISGGVDRQRILTDPKFVRTRENNQEFGGAATAGRSFRQINAPVLSTFASPDMGNRLVALLRTIISRGSGTRGRRSLDLLAQKERLQGFQYRGNQSLSSRLKVPASASASADKTELSFALNLAPRWDIVPLAAASHARIAFAGFTFSPFLYDQELGKYLPASPTEHGLFAFTYSDWLSLDDATPQTLAPALTIAPAGTLAPDTALVVILGIQYAQAVGPDFYPLAEAAAMSVLSVY